MPLQLLGMHIYNWEWISATAPKVFKPWADILGSLLVSPAYLLPPLVGLVVLVQHRSNLPLVIEPTLSWRKNALKQNKVDKHLKNSPQPQPQQGGQAPRQGESLPVQLERGALEEVEVFLP